MVVEAADDLTVRFVLREPYSPFLEYTTIGILPKHILGSSSAGSLAATKFNASPVGTGPLQVAEVSAQYLVLTPYGDYYGERPYIERFEFLFYPSNAAVFDGRRKR